MQVPIYLRTIIESAHKHLYALYGPGPGPDPGLLSFSLRIRVPILKNLVA